MQQTERRVLEIVDVVYIALDIPVYFCKQDKPVLNTAVVRLFYFDIAPHDRVEKRGVCPLKMYPVYTPRFFVARPIRMFFKWRKYDKLVFSQYHAVSVILYPADTVFTIYEYVLFCAVGSLSVMTFGIRIIADMGNIQLSGYRIAY